MEKLVRLLKSIGVCIDDDTQPVDAVYGGAFSIKEYYMESGNPRQMRGASQLLQDAAAQFDEKRYFACGSESLLLVPDGEGETYAQQMEWAFTDTTLTAKAVAVARTTTIGDLLNPAAFKALWADLNAAFYHRRMEVFANIPLPETNRRCGRCNFRDGKHFDAQTQLWLCDSCQRRQSRGGNMKNHYREKCFRHRDQTVTELPAVNDIGDLTDVQGNYALLYADINDLGRAGKNLKGNLVEYKNFTEAVQETAQTALYEAVLDVVENAKFEIIALGGDDICMLLPGGGTRCCLPINIRKKPWPCLEKGMVRVGMSTHL